MEKTVVRRGIGAVVLALVAALLLGYLLKGKAPDREKVVNMELPKSPIQIFPDGGTGAGDSTVAGTNGSADATGNTSGTQGSGVLTAVGAAGTAIVAGTGVAAGNVANAANATASAGQGKLSNLGGNKEVDAKTGNPSLDKSKVIVDGSGQAVFGAKSAGVKNAPAKIDFRTTDGKEVRPSVDGKATIKRKVASKPRKRSGAKLVGEKKLPPIGRGNVSKKAKPSKSRKVASSKSSSTAIKTTSSRNKKVTRVVTKKKAVPAGRNKYVVQLLATSNVSKANGLKATMAREGYPAYVSKANRGGKSLYRVRVGTYSGKAAALKTQSRMKRRYRKNSYIQSSIVVRN